MLYARQGGGSADRGVVPLMTAKATSGRREGPDHRGARTEARRSRRRAGDPCTGISFG